MLSPTMRKRQRERINSEAETPFRFSNDRRDNMCPMPNLPKRWNKSSFIRLLTLKNLDNSLILSIFSFHNGFCFIFEISCLAITNLQRKFDKLLFFYLFIRVGNFSQLFTNLIITNSPTHQLINSPTHKLTNS